MRTTSRSTSVLCIALAASIWACYWSILSSGFVCYDDPPYVYKNKNVLAGLTWTGIRYAWTSRECSNWHPLTWLSLELDASFWGLNPTGFHATNLALHTLNAILVFLVLRQMTNAFWRSAFVAAFFGLHPLHVESVAWIAERKDVLCTFFLLLTISMYFRYSTSPSWIRYSLVITLFALGLLAKPMLVTLPVLLLLLDFWPLNRVRSNAADGSATQFNTRQIAGLIVEKIPFFSLAFFDGLVTVYAQKNTSNYLGDVTLGARIANAFHAYFWYLQKTFVPANLIVFYPHPEEILPWTLVGLGAFVFIGVSIWTLSQWSRRPHLWIGWAWFVIALLPVIGILQVGGQAYADRYAYIPHIGLFLSFVWEISAWLSKSKMGRLIGTLGAIASLFVCGLLTRSQVAFWKDSFTLWKHALEVDPDNYVAHGHLADLYYVEGDFQRTIEHIERSLKSKRTGNIASVYCNWGACLIGLNRLSDAEGKFREALKIAPYLERALGELERLLKEQGRNDEAAQFTTRLAAIQREKQLMLQAMQTPETESAQLLFGEWHAQQNDLASAIAHFQNAILLAPQSAIPYYKLATVQSQLRRFKDSKANFIRSIELNPQLSVAHFGLARVLEAEKDFSGAKAHFAEAVRLDPADLDAKRQLDRISNQ